jgi:hypothetical protein
MSEKTGFLSLRGNGSSDHFKHGGVLAQNPFAIHIIHDSRASGKDEPPPVFRKNSIIAGPPA